MKKEIVFRVVQKAIIYSGAYLLIDSLVFAYDRESKTAKLKASSIATKSCLKVGDIVNINYTTRFFGKLFPRAVSQYCVTDIKDGIYTVEYAGFRSYSKKEIKELRETF